LYQKGDQLADEIPEEENSIGYELSTKKERYHLSEGEKQTDYEEE
jgi:hypothetical protein